jgi:hypothetical protein
MRSLLIITLLCGFAIASKAQEKPSTIFTKENAFVGASGTFNIGTADGTGVLIGLNPMYGYFIKNWLDVAAVVNLQYNSFELDPIALNNGRRKKSFLAGVGISSRIYPIDFLYIQAQPEVNAIFATENPIFSGGASGTQIKYTKIVPSLLTGVGMKRGFAKGRTFAYASILFDVLANKYSPYRSVTSYLLGTIIPSNTSGNILPIYRVGINIALSDMDKK